MPNACQPLSSYHDKSRRSRSPFGIALDQQWVSQLRQSILLTATGVRHPRQRNAVVATLRDLGDTLLPILTRVQFRRQLSDVLRVIAHRGDLFFRPLVRAVDHILVALQHVVIQSADAKRLSIPKALIKLRKAEMIGVDLVSSPERIHVPG